MSDSGVLKANSAIIAQGPLGAAQPITVGSSDTWVTGVLTADCAMVLNGMKPGWEVLVIAQQDNTGGRKLTIGGVDCQVNRSPNAYSVILVTFDGSTQVVTPLSGTSLVTSSIWIPKYAGFTTTASLPGANTYYSIQVEIQEPTTLTGITVENSSAGNILVGLLDSTGTRVAASVSTANANVSVQRVPFTAQYTPIPGIYYLEACFSSGAQGIVSTYSLCPAVQTGQGGFALPASPVALPVNVGIMSPRLATY